MNHQEDSFQRPSSAYRRLKTEEELYKAQKSILSAKGHHQLADRPSNFLKQDSFFVQNPNMALEQHMGGHIDTKSKLVAYGRFSKNDIMERKQLMTNMSISKQQKEAYRQRSICISEQTDHHADAVGAHRSSSATFLA